ncbi:ACP S-malonyltransferase [Massilia sp. PAMC28688]|uniref:ACP S-malonyltransferase n=1 Tax=Massilia sp. PAMC28688 TaxID=2861283 RepID=UPI001C635098|nr:ACP S-malonyltransferase [Massilia sp. PAMC28688]QYF92566.1 ACP S-malonyltransferase [Massilia sp. PAMC28688]
MSNFAFVFPGQGSQAVGMLNGFAGNRVVEQTVREASEALGLDLGKLMAEGPKEELDLTTNTQPVMLTASVAVYRAWLAAGGPVPSVVAGHSVGEYAALVAAGVIAFKDAVPLVRFRAQVMQEAVPVGQGGMAVVLGLGADEVRAVCAAAAAEQAGSVVEAVNFNEPTQIVIAGHTDAVERACVLAKEKGAKRAMKLAVSAPFHSSLLLPAGERLRQYMQELPFGAPQIDLINNVDVAIVNDPAAIKDALARQAAGAVRWVETMQKLAAGGITQIIESAPSKVLIGMAKRIDAGLVGEALVDQAALERVLASVQAPQAGA